MNSTIIYTIYLIIFSLNLLIIWNVSLYKKLKKLEDNHNIVNFDTTDLDNNINSLKQDILSIQRSITNLQESEKENCDVIVALRDKVDKLSEPQQITKEQIHSNG